MEEQIVLKHNHQRCHALGLQDSQALCRHGADGDVQATVTGDVHFCRMRGPDAVQSRVDAWEQIVCLGFTQCRAAELCGLPFGVFAVMADVAAGLEEPVSAQRALDGACVEPLDEGEGVHDVHVRVVLGLDDASLGSCGAKLAFLFLGLAALGIVIVVVVVEEKGGLETGFLEGRSKVVEDAMVVGNALRLLTGRNGRGEELDLDAELDLGSERWGSERRGGEQNMLHDWMRVGVLFLFWRVLINCRFWKSAVG